VLKRCNLKSLWQRCRRALRPSRARRAWLGAELLELAGIATARPVALIERRWGSLTGISYLLCEELTGWRGDVLWDAVTDEQRSNACAALAELLQRMAAARLAHGDLKPTNLWYDGQRWALVDLDALRYVAPHAAAARAHRRDCARLLKGLPAPVAALLCARLDEA
jgi:hypothetical protein